MFVKIIVLTDKKMIHFEFWIFIFPFFRYEDYENESDDEVDWKELAKAIEKYQTLKGILHSFVLHWSM